ncbi:putative mRNA export protein mlo3 [Halenospora varia]|nr:putative mRNA export protein mlo3 [Halenospora varia]
MSGKLDQSLDEILSTRRSSARGRGRGGRRVSSRTTKAAPAAPVGGVKKNPKTGKSNKAIPTGPSGGNGESKILVSNLPKDVSEAMIKEYFAKSIGAIKRVDISYGPGGVSRGIATIVFSRPDSAAKAVENLNGVLVDGKSMKIDVVLDARHAAAIPPPKGLSERITSQPKSQPKSAAVTKATPSTRGKATRGRGKAKNARPAKKTAEELDSEMVDYFGGGNAETDAAASGAAQPAAGGDANMDDEIL